MLAFVTITVTWGDPFTRAAEQREQRDLARQFVVPTARHNGTSTLASAQVTRIVARRHQATTRQGAVVGKITIPTIGVSKYIVNGTSDANLNDGPGLYPERGFPGSGGPVGIAGHRTTHGAPFLKIDELSRGDRITVRTGYGTFRYRVTRTEIIAPDDWSILTVGAFIVDQKRRSRAAATGLCNGGPKAGGSRQGCEHLVLTACHPKYSAAQRIAVFARLESARLNIVQSQAGA